MHARALPGMSLFTYLLHILKYCKQTIIDDQITICFSAWINSSCNHNRATPGIIYFIDDCKIICLVTFLVFTGRVGLHYWRLPRGLHMSKSGPACSILLWMHLGSWESANKYMLFSCSPSCLHEWITWWNMSNHKFTFLKWGDMTLTAHKIINTKI